MYDKSQVESRMLERFLRFMASIFLSRRSRLTYEKAEELIREQGEFAEFVLPPETDLRVRG